MSNDIEIIKSRLDIVDLVSQYVDLKKAGANYQAVCPFHNEKTPSFMVNPSLQIFKCFGCGKGGDLITFIQEIEKLDFRGALEFAAEKAGVELSDNNIKKDKKLEDAKKRAIEATTLAAKFYNYILKTHANGKKGRDYAAKRGLSAKEIEKFMFGYAPNTKKSLKDYLTKKGFNEKELVAFGLLIDRGEVIDKFRNRLMQPIWDLRGNIVAFSGRYIGESDKAPKYLNSPETIIYKKNETLYGLYNSLEAIRKDGFVVLVEGNLDVVAPHKIGFENIAAPLGTAFTEAQAKLLKRYVDLIYFCFDSDKAGLNSLIRALSIVENLGIRHKVLDLLKYKDPDELIKAEPQAWKKVIENAKSTISFLFSKLSSDLDLGNSDDKITFRNRIFPILKMIKDEVELNHYIKEASVLLEINQDELLESLKSGKIRPQKKESEPEEIEVSHSKSDIEDYFGALFVQYAKIPSFEIDIKIFENKKIADLVEVLKELENKIDNDVIGQLDPETVEVYKNMTIYNLSKIENFESELKLTYKRLLVKNLKQQILKLRKALMLNEDDNETLKRLGELTKELKNAESS